MTQTQQTQDKKHVNLAIKLRGYLGHNNYLWDLKCPNCNRLYSHFETNVCPNCSAPLQWLTTANGQKTMAISEGTIYPLLTDKEKERYEKHRAAVGGLKPTFRFKIFAFGSDIASPPPLPDNHENMVKGALVELLVINHWVMMIPYTSKKTGEPAIEVSIPIFKEYGDSVKIISAPRQVAQVGTQPQMPQQIPQQQIAQPQPQVSVGNLQQQIAQMEQMLQMIKSQMASNPQPAQVQTAAQPVNPFEYTETVKTQEGTEVPVNTVANTLQNDDVDVPF